eukprot:scaffold721_cov131-Cylindrotheca_fusiformis.AAC.34
MMKSAILSLLVASASAFAPASQTQRVGSVSLNAEEMSKSIPFLVRPEKLDGSMPADLGFDPMRLSDIQQDLTYARWSELKHGRICMLALVGMVVQQSGLHIPGEQFTNTDIFGAVSSVGFAGNIQIFMAIGIVEGINFNKHYDGSTPGEIGWEGAGWSKLTDSQKAFRKESEVVHCRLAMIAFHSASALVNSGRPSCKVHFRNTIAKGTDSKASTECGSLCWCCCPSGSVLGRFALDGLLPSSIVILSSEVAMLMSVVVFLATKKKGNDATRVQGMVTTCRH